MREFLLFIDTEASGLPKKWDLPYSRHDNWPFTLQISWVIYSRSGTFIKQENHYINEPGITITEEARKIHGITPEHLAIHGKKRQQVMQLLSDDLLLYNPVVIGHFIELDLHLAGVEFHRCGMENTIRKLPAFCTMQASRHLTQLPQEKYLRLGELYELLFHSPLKYQHNSLTDATATALCFFELKYRNEIKEEEIERQQAALRLARRPLRKIGLALLLLLIILTIILIACCI